MIRNINISDLKSFVYDVVGAIYDDIESQDILSVDGNVIYHRTR
jgi:hypothetical protein